MKKIPLILLLLSSTAFAQPQQAPQTFPVQLSEQDGALIRQICDAARTSSALTLEAVANVSQYCLGLLGRITSAHANQKPEAEKDKK
jgi:hypothetical protein